MTTVEADVVDLPEFRDNPFIAKLPPLMPAIDILRALADPPIYQETERTYPAHLRAECVHRLGRYFEPLERHLQLASKFATLLRQGYISRNPLGADFIHWTCPERVEYPSWSSHFRPPRTPIFQQSVRQYDERAQAMLDAVLSAEVVEAVSPNLHSVY